jgi:hypothetical protein
MPGLSGRHLRAIGSVGLIAATVSMAMPAAGHEGPQARHVLLLSVDGMHQSDLARYVGRHPNSALAKLAGSGAEFTNARTPVPSDSFPGLVGQVTGGNPSSTGVYYDDSFNRALLPAGTTSCAGVAPGAEVTYFEAADKDPLRLDAGQGLVGLPGSIMDMTSDPTTVLDPMQLPVDPSTCKPVYPHSYLKVNTVFEVARAAGLRTAWSDKHPAYEILNGPSGTGVQDLFTPEINSNAPAVPSSRDWTQDNLLTQQYDSYKVQAVINEINGFDHSGRIARTTPALFGMNFQTVSTAEKLPTSNSAAGSGLQGGYLADGVTPGPVLTGALDYINLKVGEIVDAIRDRGLTSSTAIILSAKHGQSPQTPSALTRIPDGPIIDALNAAWKAERPGATKALVAFAINDDGMLMWLNDRSEDALDFARNFLLEHSGTGNDINRNPKPYTSSGLTRVFAGEEAAEYFKVKAGDPRVPDIFGIAQYGVVYTGGKGKIAEHGDANPQDLEVPLLVSGGAIGEHVVQFRRVETAQIAPTILKLLGLDPTDLRAVQVEHTRALPLD